MASGCRRLSDRGLRTVAQSCPELRRMEVAGCYNVSNEAVFDVVSRCPNLEHLDVSGKHRSQTSLKFFFLSDYDVFLSETWYKRVSEHKRVI